MIEQFVGLLDFRNGAVFILLVLVFLVAILRWQYGRWLSLEGALQVAFGMFCIWTGIVLGVVFLISRPPSFGQLSRGDIGLVGLVAVITTFAIGLSQVRKAIWPKDPQPKLPARR